jgi:RNA polymerase sigma-70 factor (ECF subfamily)
VSETTTPIEEELRAACLAGNFDDAATRAIRTYGPELLGYVHAMLRNPVDADDVFASACERMWKALPEFQWRSSLKTWAYTLVRNASITHIRKGVRAAKPVASVASIAAEIRSQTASYLKTPVKDKLAEIRASLDPDDQTLLILRIDRQLPWKDVARVFEGEDAEDASIDRRAAALRKRLERLKDELREKLSS